MTTVGIAQPDVTLLLDLDGMIREVTVAGSIPGENVQGWVGKPWGETLGDTGGGEKVKRMLDDARSRGISAFRQVTQRFPSGLELPMEYTTVLLGGRAGMLAIGKNLQAVAELQARLISAQQTIERDYWKLRDVETRYRLLFDASNDAVLVLRAANLRIAEANLVALQALNLSGLKQDAAVNRDIIPLVALQDREALQGMLSRVREHGKAPGILVHFGDADKPWMVRASLMTAEPGPLFLVQLAPVDPSQIAPERGDVLSVDEVVERVPDGFVVLDREGAIRRANRAFLDLVEAGAESSVIGERLARWLSRPGADITVLLANVAKHGSVRLFSTTISGELGTESEVEISAASAGKQFIGVMIRNVSRRLAAPADGDRLLSALGPISEQVGKSSLRKLVKDTVGVVERHYVKQALELANGNRTAASELLGLSRQSLYTKLNRYGMDGGSGTESDTE